MAVPEKRTYHIEVRNNRGKVVLERDLARNSQWSAHTALRRLFADQPTGTKATLSTGGKAIEEFVMHSEGWEFSVLNGDSVSAASRKARGVKDALPKQTGGKQAAARKVTTHRAVKPKTKAQKAARSKATRSAEAPF
jgi:hypothetical protein